MSQARDVYGLGYKNIQVSVGLQAMLLGQVGLHNESLHLWHFLLGVDHRCKEALNRKSPTNRRYDVGISTEHGLMEI